MRKLLVLLFLFQVNFNSFSQVADPTGSEKNQVVVYLAGLSNFESAKALANYFDTVKEKITFYKIDMQTQTLYLRFAEFMSKEEILQCVRSQFSSSPVESEKLHFEHISELENPTKSGIVLNKQK